MLDDGVERDVVDCAVDVASCGDVDVVLLEDDAAEGGVNFDLAGLGTVPVRVRFAVDSYGHQVEVERVIVLVWPGGQLLELVAGLFDIGPGQFAC